MRESTAYQVILDEGRAEGLNMGRIEEARKLLLRLGRQRLGPPEETVEVDVQAINEVDRLERLMERVLTVTNWQDLLSTP